MVRLVEELQRVGMLLGVLTYTKLSRFALLFLHALLIELL